MNSMKKIYIAGRYSAPSIIEALENIRRGRRKAAELLMEGNAVFCPWLDSELFLQLRDGEKIDLETIQEHSIAWMMCADLVYVLRGWEASKGTIAEIARAKELGIEVQYEV
jgi:hypothetical protein